MRKAGLLRMTLATTVEQAPLAVYVTELVHMDSLDRATCASRVVRRQLRGWSTGHTDGCIDQSEPILRVPRLQRSSRDLAVADSPRPRTPYLLAPAITGA